MAVTALTQMPCSIDGGTTTRLSITRTDYPTSAWTAQLVLNNGKDAPTSITGTINATAFEFVITAAQSTTLGAAAQPFQFAFVFTETASSDVEIGEDCGDTGAVRFLPSVLATATPTDAEANVTRLQATIAKLTASRSSARSFSGQSSTDADMEKYQKQLTYWQARVIAEKAQLAASRGQYAGGGIGVSFGSDTHCGC